MSVMSQPGPNVSWLDEELRKERALTQELRETIDKQQVTLVDQHQRILALEDGISRLQAQLMRIPGVEEALQHTRDELVLRMSEMRQELQKNQTEFLRNRQTEREQDQRAIQEMRLELQRLAPIEQALAVQKAEERRLNETLLRLQQDMEETAKRQGQADDQRRLLGDTISKNGIAIRDAENRLGDVIKEQQNVAARLLGVDPQIKRLDQQVAGLETMRQEISKENDAMQESARRADQARTQQLTEWGRRLEALAHQIDTWADQLRFFTDQHEKNRRVLREIQDLAQEVSQQQERLKQLQRIAEEHLRRELIDLQAESERRWTKERERREAAELARTQYDEVLEGRLADTEVALQAHLERLSAIDEALSALRVEHISRFTEQERAQHRSLEVMANALAKLASEAGGALGREDKP